ncbi:MAG: FlgD immunoglobulin-like domain containing protein, partial [Candidatus Eisenbacteria bacterium]
SYLSQGGRLFVSSMDCLTGISNPNNFFNNYLGVASWTTNTKANTAVGVNGDPITNGMSIPLSYPSQQANRVDTLVPGGASVIFNSELGAPAAVRYERPDHVRTVFSTIIQTAFNNGPDPNNSQKFIQNALTWLLQFNTTAVEPGDGKLASRMLSASPNPFTPRTELTFQLSSRAAGSPVSLVVVDASGRQVKTLTNGMLSAGAHHIMWDGSDEAARTVASGVYFARLKTVEGESSQKLLHVR